MEVEDKSIDKSFVSRYDKILIFSCSKIDWETAKWNCVFEKGS